MDIERIEHGSKGAFIIKVNNKRLAEMTYSKAGDKLIIIDHTEVSDALRGKGAGKQLVTAAVEYVRKNQIKILPLARLQNQYLINHLSLTMCSTPDFDSSHAAHSLISLSAALSPV
ncbi:MAG: GNAT family N-acetyltransferase [Cyclobacteriaceae bacterium]